MEKNKKKYDYLLIGSGQGNNPLASALAEKNTTVALIENNQIGGACINWGCTPTKTMAASAQVAWLANHAKDWGVLVDNVQVNFRAVMARKDQLVAAFRKGTEKSIQENKQIDIIKGTARFASENELLVETKQGEITLTGTCIIINTGSRARIPDIRGIEAIRPLTAHELMELKELPKKLLVVGAGYLGLEFGQMFHRFGSQVTLLESGTQIAAHEDADIAACLQGILEQEGLEILLRATASRIKKGANGNHILYFTDASGEEHQRSFTHLLLGAGRIPNTEALRLEAAGIQVDKDGYIEVNETLQTSVKHIYALGDVKGGPAFTHIAYDDYRILADQLLGKQQKTTRGRMVPYTLFTEPQLGRIGLTEQQAKEKQVPYIIAEMPAESAARARETGRTAGKMKVIIHAETRQILGAAMLCLQGGELMGAIQIAMMGKLTYPQLRDATFAHPTLTESLNNLFSTIED